MVEIQKLCCFYHRADALGAQGLLHLASALHHGNLLKVRVKGTIGRPQRKGAVVTEGGGFPTMSALSHVSQSFLAIIPKLSKTDRRSILTRVALNARQVAPALLAQYKAGLGDLSPL